MYGIIIVKTLFIYFFIAFMYRIMGKKEVGQLSIVDLIVSILIAELGALSIENVESSLLVSIIPILVIVFIQIALGYFSLKSSTLRNVIDGKPAVIIKDGKLNFKEMTHLRYSLDDLVSQLREQGISSIEDVTYAVLENNGKLSVFQKAKEYPMPIILDGKIDEHVLQEIGKDTVWLYRLLKERNIPLSSVFYAFYTKKKTFIITKSDLL